MDECPHCGEPIDEDAESCRYCGSDFETGWKPDQDYYAVELPEDDLEVVPGYSRDSAAAGWQNLLGASLVAVTGIVFLGAAAYTYRGAVTAFAMLLAACLFVFYGWVLPGKKTRA